jgi:hypothetical protein
VAVIDIPNKFVQTRLEDDKDKAVIRLHGKLAKLTVKVAPVNSCGTHRTHEPEEAQNPFTTLSNERRAPFDTLCCPSNNNKQQQQQTTTIVPLI